MRRPALRWLGAAVALGAPLLVSGVTRAEDSPLATSPLSVDIAPTLSATMLFDGWNELLVRLRNGGSTDASGTIEITCAPPYGDEAAFTVEAPFSVAAGATASVRVPFLKVAFADAHVVVKNDAGKELASKHMSASGSPGDTVFLVDVHETSRVRPFLNDAPIVPSYDPSGSRGAAGSTPVLRVGSPSFDPTTGDPALPQTAAAYSGAAAVLIDSDALTRLRGDERNALAGYVLAGGTIAIAVTRPEDLRDETITALVGGAIEQGRADPAVLRELLLPEATGAMGEREVPYAASPTEALGPTLSGYFGGNLHPSPYGSSASYGLGEVHLLAFDPSRAAASGDPWVTVRLIDLSRRAYDRRSSVAYGHGTPFLGYVVGLVRKQLDPNESSRWAIGAAAILLCLYAFVAGPINFSRASKKGKPLAALRWLPLIAAVAFALVVAVGVSAKGVVGRARHLTLVEAGPGMTVGTARRWRGFYTSNAKDLVIRPSDRASVVSAAPGSMPEDAKTRLLVDRDGARIVDSEALPWQTVVVREDGFAELGEGIAVTKLESGDVAVVNRSGRAMRAALLRLPGADPIYFPKIADGERRVASSGRTLNRTVEETDFSLAIQTPRGAGLLTLNPLAAYALGPIVDRDAPGLAAAWSAIEETATGQVDWFPDDVPVLLAQLDGGEGVTTDSGLRVESDRLLVRIVGYGGAP